MGKSKKDACGGHANRFIETRAGICGNSAHFRRFAKDRSNRLIRRQFKKAEAEAYHDYLDDLEERRIFERELEEYSMLMDEMYSHFDDEYTEDELHDRFADYDDDYGYDPFDSEPAFIYERDYERSYGNDHY